MMDENRAAQFTGRVLTDSAAVATIVLAALGDRTGLFKDMAEHGPATSGELAGRTGLSERYVREWLGGMFAAGYLTYDDAQQRYALPAEHVPTLEIRVADTSADVDTTLLLAALVRGLATTMLAELPEDPDAADAGPPGADTTAMIDAAHWSAAQSGIHGNGPDPVTGRIVPMRLLVDRLVERARPGLEAAGDLGTVRLLLSGLCAAGTGADRQRAAFARRGRYGDVVDELAALTAEA